MAPLTPISRRALVASVTVVAVVLLGAIPRGIHLDVVDVIPPAWNLDATSHPEPTIAVNPRHPGTIAVSAYLIGDVAGPASGYCGPMYGGVLMSNDGGRSWRMSCLLPKAARSKIGDLSLDYTGDGATLLASYFSPSGTLHVVERRQFLANALLLPTTVETLSADGDLDQPFVVAALGATSHSYTVGFRQQTPGCAAGGVIAWWNTIGANSSTCVAVRPAEGLINVRTAHAPDGRVYGLFFSTNGDDLTSDLVLVRGQLPTTNATMANFDELHDVVLLDSHAQVGSPCAVPDHALGQRLRNCALVPIDAWDDSRSPGCGPGVGSQSRNPDQVAIAIDPGDSHTVYYAYGDSVPGRALTLHLMRWSDAGGTQTNQEIRPPVHDALNPAVVITRTGRVGFAYQQFSGGYWRTRLQVSSRDRSTWDTVPLSGLSSDNEPVADCGLTSPYLGDYVDIAAVSDTIYGVFSFNNNPAVNPNARYLRDQSLLGPTGVPYAIDPFFYKVTFDRPLYSFIGPNFNRIWNRTVARLKQMLRTRAPMPPPPDSVPPPGEHRPG